MNSSIETLKSLGGNYWERDGKRRVYFSADKVFELAGGSIHRYSTGNISSARLNGEHISNGQAGKIIGAIDKFWYDVEYEKFMCKTFSGNADVVLMRATTKLTELLN